MAFLDNSGDIILDAVLTDTGRKRLAQGDGSFRITKFALGDDEIDYESYDNQNPSGSAYYDLEIMQTPVFEAFTNNTSNMNSKIITITRSNLLYLPVLKRNAISGMPNAGTGSLGTILIAATDTTSKTLSDLAPAISAYINGNDGTQTNGGIRVDQGIDNDSSNNQKLDSDLTETQYMIEIDNRLGTIVGGDVSNSNNIVAADASFIDDDQIAVYYLSQGTDSPGFVESIPVSTTSDTNTNTVIAGAVGTELHFSIKASQDLNNSGNFLFTRLGSTMAIDGTNFYYIDTNVRISGVTTGYRIDIPVRFVKNA
jgi:hypothetical protein